MGLDHAYLEAGIALDGYLNYFLEIGGHLMFYWLYEIPVLSLVERCSVEGLLSFGLRRLAGCAFSTSPPGFSCHHVVHGRGRSLDQHDSDLDV